MRWKTLFIEICCQFVSKRQKSGGGGSVFAGSVLDFSKTSRSRTLMTGWSCDIGRYEDPKWQDLPTLGISLILAYFQVDVKFADCIDKL